MKSLTMKQNKNSLTDLGIKRSIVKRLRIPAHKILLNLGVTSTRILARYFQE